MNQHSIKLSFVAGFAALALCSVATAADDATTPVIPVEDGQQPAEQPAEGTLPDEAAQGETAGQDAASK
jgi:Spy/CpxP family protein refolding chaperone